MTFNKIKEFLKDSSGQISIMAVFLLIPLTVFIGGGVDLANRLNNQNKQQNALDMALLSAVKVEIDEIKYPSKAAQEEIRAVVFMQMFKANFGDENLPEISFVFGDKGMTANASDSVQTTFLKLANIDSMDFNVSASSLYPKQATFEIVLIFDATGSMGGIINTVKRNAINFTGDVLRSLEEKGVKLDSIYTKVISYKDYWVDRDPMFESRFYELPKENSAFAAIINPIRASGGGDLPESGLEALKFAIDSKSPARRVGVDANKLIVLWTDAEAIPLKNDRKAAANNGLVTTIRKRWLRWYPWYNRDTWRYPSGMPETLSSFKSLWNRDANAELLLFYGNRGRGANFYPWKQMKGWNRIEHVVSNPNNINYSTMINKISTKMSEMTKTRLTR